MNAETLLEASVALAIAAELVHSEPKVERMRMFWEERLFDELPYAQDDPIAQRGQAFMGSWFDGITVENLEQKTSEVRSEWLRLFVGVGSPLAPGLESVYYQGKGHLTSERTIEVRRLYKRYGLQVAEKGKEPDDELGFMLSFVSRLLGLEAQAVEAGDDARAEELQGVQREMLEGHILYWVPRWFVCMKSAAKTDYYQGVADLAFGILGTLAGRFGLEIK